MKMKFTKMHGCGNDYIYVDGQAERIPAEEKPELVRRLSDRHFGIGGDGVIFINPSDVADFEMEMYNLDGSRAEMCGNGIRCVAKFVYDKKLTDKTSISICSFGKIKYLDLYVSEGKVSTVKVNMGSPVLEAEEIPVIFDGNVGAGGSAVENAGSFATDRAVIDEKIEVDGREYKMICVQGKDYKMTCVSMGNPHAVVFMDEVSTLPLDKIGPGFENHVRFPKRVNTEFVKVIDRDNVEMRVWERGTGETLACGTGACATAVNGLTNEKVTVKLTGGSLDIRWDREENLVYMTGPATTVFEGEIEI